MGIQTSRWQKIDGDLEQKQTAFIFHPPPYYETESRWHKRNDYHWQPTSRKNYNGKVIRS